MKVGSGGKLGLSREYFKKLFGPMFCSWCNTVIVLINSTICSWFLTVLLIFQVSPQFPRPVCSAGKAKRGRGRQRRGDGGAVTRARKASGQDNSTTQLAGKRTLPKGFAALSFLGEKKQRVSLGEEISVTDDSDLEEENEQTGANSNKRTGPSDKLVQNMSGLSLEDDASAASPVLTKRVLRQRNSLLSRSDNSESKRTPHQRRLSVQQPELCTKRTRSLSNSGNSIRKRKPKQVDSLVPDVCETATPVTSISQLLANTSIHENTGEKHGTPGLNSSKKGVCHKPPPGENSPVFATQKRTSLKRKAKPSRRLFGGKDQENDGDISIHDINPGALDLVSIASNSRRLRRQSRRLLPKDPCMLTLFETPAKMGTDIRGPVLAEDTPEALYGLSVRQRRLLRYKRS